MMLVWLVIGLACGLWAVRLALRRVNEARPVPMPPRWDGEPQAHPRTYRATIDRELRKEFSWPWRQARAWQPDGFRHPYFHAGPQDCRDYKQCHDRATGA